MRTLRSEYYNLLQDTFFYLDAINVFTELMLGRWCPFDAAMRHAESHKRVTRGRAIDERR